MSREIKFRGIANNVGKWVYGDYFRNGTFHFIRTISEVGFTSDRDIDPETVGQFTGLLDKNGKEIYEGDLIKVCDNDNGYLQVEFVNDYVGGWVLSHESTSDKLSLGARKAHELEVIGTVHDK